MLPLDVPVISALDLANPDSEVQAKVRADLLRGFGHYGLIYIKDHGIDKDAVHKLYDDFSDVLDRPAAEKATWGGPEIYYQRGWTPPNTEQAVVAGGQPDFKECFFAAPLPLDPLCARWYPEIYGENIWPDKAEDFRDGMLSAGQGLHQLGADVLRACEGALGVRPGSITEHLPGAAHVSRILKYLALDEEQTEQDLLWGEEHTDFNLLTLLPGGRMVAPNGEKGGRPPSGPGLFLRTRATEESPKGQMVRGTPPAGCIVAQVGQQLEVLTAGRFLATPHVITAPKEPGWTRTSLAHFVHMHGRAIVEPMLPFRESTKYCPPVLAGTWALKTLVDIGLAPPSQLNKLGYRFHERLIEQRQED